MFLFKHKIVINRNTKQTLIKQVPLKTVYSEQKIIYQWKNSCLIFKITLYLRIVAGCKGFSFPGECWRAEEKSGRRGIREWIILRSDWPDRPLSKWHLANWTNGWREEKRNDLLAPKPKEHIAARKDESGGGSTKGARKVHAHAGQEDI